MKRILFWALVVFSALFGLSSCLKEADETILVNDPQQVKLLTEWPADLLELFGEKNVFFGDVPPEMNCSFRAFPHKYVEVHIDGMAGPPIGTLTPIARYFKFEEQYFSIAKLHCSQANGTDTHRAIYPVYLMGRKDEGTFTAYFTDTVPTPGTPVHKVMVSGRLSERGVTNYRYGYKIVEYLDADYQGNVYPVNSVFVFEDGDGIAEYEDWYVDERK